MTMQRRLYLAVGLGGMLGSVARSLVSIGLLHLMGPGFAWGTLAVNVGLSGVLCVRP
jgi:fluoride exporter